MTSPKPISLVIPAYNEEAYIGDCIAAAQKYGADYFKEIVVVDNASTDGTAAIAASFPGVRVVREERKGTNYARDRGFRETTGELVAFFDADCRVRPGWCEKVMRAFADPELACITGPYWYYDLPYIQSLLLWLNWHIALIGNLLWHSMGVGGNMVLRRSVLEKMGGFDTSYTFNGDDVDTARRASTFGKMRLDFSIIVDSSGRRYQKHGILRTLWFYTENVFVTLFKRPKKDPS